MDLLRRLQCSSRNKDFRRRANDIYEHFPFFELSSYEFCSRCVSLQRCGAGVVLGRAKQNFVVRIIAYNEHDDEKNCYENLPLGQFGEIVFLSPGAQVFTHTGLYGYFDQRGRIWCCGKISDTTSIGQKKYFPYCIEPLYERMWWVKSAKLKIIQVHRHLKVIIVPRNCIIWFVKIFEKYLMKQLKNFSKRFLITTKIKKFQIKY